MAWYPGTTIVLQEVWRGRFWSARPVIVVEDMDERLVQWWPRGTRWKAPSTPPSRERAPTRAQRFDSIFALRDWVFRDAVATFSNLILIRPHEWHEVIGFQRP